MLKHGVVMDVTNVEQAKIAEGAGAVAVMVLDKLPYDVRKVGGVARTASPKVAKDILETTTIPVMGKCRIGHTAEARVLEELGVDMVAATVSSSALAFSNQKTRTLGLGPL